MGEQQNGCQERSGCPARAGDTQTGTITYTVALQVTINLGAPILGPAFAGFCDHHRQEIVNEVVDDMLNFMNGKPTPDGRRGLGFALITRAADADAELARLTR